MRYEYAAVAMAIIGTSLANAQPKNRATTTSSPVTTTKPTGAKLLHFGPTVSCDTVLDFLYTYASTVDQNSMCPVHAGASKGPCDGVVGFAVLGDDFDRATEIVGSCSASSTSFWATRRANQLYYEGTDLVRCFNGVKSTTRRVTFGKASAQGELTLAVTDQYPGNGGAAAKTAYYKSSSSNLTCGVRAASFLSGNGEDAYAVGDAWVIGSLLDTATQTWLPVMIVFSHRTA